MCRKVLDGEDYVEIEFRIAEWMDVILVLCTDCAYSILSRYSTDEFREVKRITWSGQTWRMEIYPSEMSDSDIEELKELIKDRKLFPEETLPIPPSLAFSSQRTPPDVS